MNQTTLPGGTCANCRAALLPAFAYCPACGQSTEPKPESFGSVVREVLEESLSFDSKVFRSLKPLLFRPGFLTEEYIRGRRVSYIPPLRMYLTISLLSFLMLAVNKPSRTRHRPAETAGMAVSKSGGSRVDADQQPVEEEAGEIAVPEAFWDNFFDSMLPRLFFVLVPLYGLIQALLYRRQGRFYIHHLVFSLHFHSFVFVGLLAYMLVSSYVTAGFPSFNRMFMAVAGAGVLVYLFLALKRVYGQSYAKTALKFGLLASGYTVTFVVFLLAALFWHYSLR